MRFGWPVDSSLPVARMALALVVTVVMPSSGGLGCGAALRPFAQGHVEIQEYKPLLVPTAVGRPVRWQKLKALAIEQGWRIDTADERRGLVIGARPTGDAVEVREHVRVVLRPQATEIAVQTEVFEDGEWDLRDFTSGRYEYSRETEIALRLDR